MSASVETRSTRGETASCPTARDAGLRHAEAASAAQAGETPAVPGENRIFEILACVPDPEIPCVSVVDLGIVREVRDDTLVITPTYSGCPATIAIAHDIRKALDDAGFAGMKIETALSPPWTTDWISDEGRDKLRAYGIAPPPKGAARHTLRDAPPQCPRCGSTHTEELSRFGSTPCKALHRCCDCSEPFDRFKCH